MLHLENPNTHDYNVNEDMIPYIFASPISFYILHSVGVMPEITDMKNDLESWGNHIVYEMDPEKD